MKKQLTVGRVVCDLLFLSLIGMVVFGVSYARYTSSVSGSATGAVAALALDGKITSAWIDIGNMQPGAVSYTHLERVMVILSAVCQVFFNRKR